MEETKQRINADIPIDLYTRLKNSSLSITDTVVKGFEQALNGKDENYYTNILQSKENIIKSKDGIIQALTNEKENYGREKKEFQKQLSAKDNQLLKLKGTIQETEDNKSNFVRIVENNTFFYIWIGALALSILYAFGLIVKFYILPH